MGIEASQNACCCSDNAPLPNATGIDDLPPSTADDCNGVIFKDQLGDTLDEQEDEKSKNEPEVLVRSAKKLVTKTQAELDKMAQQKKKRQGISAEVVTKQQVTDFVKPVYFKSPEEEEKIMSIVKENAKMQVLVGRLTGPALHDVLNAFFAKQVKKGEHVIKQGDAGDCLYICEQGELDIFVARPGADGKIKDGDLGTKVLSVGAGALFGELALMYMAPRAATVTVTSTTAKLWALEREPFKMLLVQTGEQQFDMYEGWLKEVEIFKSLNHHELAKIADSMESVLYDADEVIIKQGDEGECFYIVEDGTCSAYISGADGDKEVKAYEAGDYFGEIALLTNEPRRATIRGTGEGCSVIFISKECFTNLLGPVADILNATIDKYPKYVEILKKS